MRKPLFLAFLLISSVAVAQRFDPFKLNASVGYASPADRSGNKDGSKPGFVYSLEPQFGLTRHFDIGIRFEQAFIQRPEVLGNLIYFDSQAKSIMSGALTLNYVVGRSVAFRPYVGAGIGLYRAAGSEQQVMGAANTTLFYTLPVTNKMAGLFRVGIKFWQFNVEAAYNRIDDTTVTNEFTNAKLIGKNEYFSLKAGYTLGGKLH
ncbi:porin family protein [Spirosoma agri]|uniref:Porin family protein n=1 Tax=Spirosoma agri TaxID=1987381 RepID=A0A6M0IG08_9BACT|nr:porin family protein [Spirosoma agri]NEU66685.1 porin family protein [Spirosoma agri]